MASKMFTFEDKVILCDFSGDKISIKQVDEKNEATRIKCTAEPLIPSAGMFYFNDTEFRQYYVWYNKEGHHKDPAPGGKKGVEVLIKYNDTGEAIAQKTKQAINSHKEMSVSFQAEVDKDVLVIMNKYPGDVPPPSDFNSGFSIDVIQKGQYTTDLYTGHLWKDCAEIKDFVLHKDGSAEVFYAKRRLYLERLNSLDRFERQREHYVDVYKTIPKEWITFI